MCRHKDWIKTALQHANKSEVKKYKHCSLLVKGGRIISIGINKNKEGRLGDPLYGVKGWHSELDVLIGLHPERVKGATLYVVGISRGSRVVCSKPCIKCQEYLKRFELKEVVYSMPEEQIGRMVV